MRIRNSRGKTVFKASEPAGCLSVLLIVLFTLAIIREVVHKLLNMI